MSTPEAGPEGSQLRRLALHPATGSVFASGWGQLALVVSGIVAARLLGVEDRGHLALLVLFPAVLSQIGALGLPLAVTYTIARKAHAGQVARTIVLPALLQAVAIMVALAGVLWLVFADDRAGVRAGAAIMLAAVPALVAQQYGLAILQGQHQFARLNALRQLPAFLYATAICGALLAGKDKLELVAGLWVAAYTLAAIVIVSAAVRSVRGARGDEIPSRRRMARFGLKGFVGQLSPIEVFRLDQLLVGLLLSATALGLYVVALAFTTFPRLISYSIGVVAYPRVAAERDRKAARRLAWRYFWVSGAVTGAFVGCLVLAAPWTIGTLFGPDFEAAATTAQILLVSSLFLSLRRVLIDSGQGLGHPELGAISELAMWLALAPALVALVPAWGIEGVATALAIGSAVSLVAAVVLLLVRSRGVSEPGGTKRGLARLAVAGVAIGVGVAATALPGLVVALLAVTGAVVLFVVLGRSALARRPRLPRHKVSAMAEVVPDAEEARHLRLPRLFYYLGLLFIGQLTFRPALGLTLSDWLFLVALIVTLAILALTHEHLRASMPSVVLVGAVLVALGALTASFVAEDWVVSLAVTLRLLYLTIAWFWLGTVLLRSVRQIATAVTMWVASAALSGGAAVVQFVFGDVLPTARGDSGRLTGFTDHVNDLGGLSAVALVPALALAVHGVARGRVRILHYILLGLVVAGLLLSGSVGGFVAATAGLLVWLAATRPARRVWVVAVVGAVAVLVLAKVQADAGAPTPLERVTTVTGEEGVESATLWTRLDSYRLAWEEIASGPVVGVGMDEASSIIPQLGQPVHNIFLGFWHSAGILGVFGILTIVVAIAHLGVRTVRLTTGTPTAPVLAPALLASFAAFVVFGMGAPILYKRYGWVAAALILALAAWSARRSPAPPEVRPVPRATAFPRVRARRWAT